ncbi:MAG: helix-turn-helix transcriptional regulator [Actinobacteria bacterium]|nr:MAG: helix-turn-helix transcriptional regulator [Actinomycetota bacterium]
MATRPAGEHVSAWRPVVPGVAEVCHAHVAASVGFSDQSHLTRQFKRHLGVSPGRYAGSADAR